MRHSLLFAVLGLGAVLLAGCGSTVCDKSGSFDPASKTGDCAVGVPAAILGTKAACDSALSACDEGDKKILEGVMACWEGLATCEAATQDAWVGQSNGCYAEVSSLSGGCRDAFFSEGVPGGGDGDVDAGIPDAGPQPDADGGGALDLIITASESQVAMAWTRTQLGPVDHWEVYSFNAAELAEPPKPLPAGSMTYSEALGLGEKKRYFVVGFNDAGEVAYGDPTLVENPVDAGAVMCSVPLDCPPDNVCNLGQCEVLACVDSNICPAGYLCANMRCERMFGFGDGGMVGMGQDAGVERVPRPFISESQQISTSEAGFSGDRVVSDFAALNIDIAAVDTARQFMIMEQEGQIFGYFTENRGKSFRIVSIDAIGTQPKVVFEPKSKTLFACYNAVGGIRVRASRDFGKSWPFTSLDITSDVNPDGGASDLISDCDLAPWQDGQVLIAALTGPAGSPEAVKMWTVKPDLTLAQPDPVPVFTSSATQFSPKDLAIATLPDDFMVHVLFAFTRFTVQMTPDQDIAGYYRTSMTNGFVAKPVTGAPGTQSSPAVILDPVTKRGVAAWVSNESPAGGGAVADTIYLGFWTPSEKWATGSDLNVFARDSVSGSYVVVPSRQPGELWEAQKPSLAASGDGKIVLGFVSGKETAGVAFLKAWSVPFDFNATNILIPAIKGYYIPPAQAVSETRVARAAAKDTAGPIVTADQQISFYYGFVEGVGSQGEVPNRPVLVSKPK